MSWYLLKKLKFEKKKKNVYNWWLYVFTKKKNKK